MTDTLETTQPHTATNGTETPSAAFEPPENPFENATPLPAWKAWATGILCTLVGVGILVLICYKLERFKQDAREARARMEATP